MHYDLRIEPEKKLCLDKDAVTKPLRPEDRRINNGAPQLIPTHNRTGYITTFADPFAQAFINRAILARGPVLELAAGYGLPSIAAVEGGCLNATVSDLDPSHLEWARSRPESGKTLHVVQGALPDHPGLQDDSFEVIFLSRVLHFFDGPTVMKTLRKIRRWLYPGGELIVVCDSVYQKQFEFFRATYSERLHTRKEWPGYFENMGPIHGNRIGDLPDIFHFFDIESLTNLGFWWKLVFRFKSHRYFIVLNIQSKRNLMAVKLLAQSPEKHCSRQSGSPVEACRSHGVLIVPKSLVCIVPLEGKGMPAAA